MVLHRHAHNSFCKQLYLKIKPSRLMNTSRCLYHSLKGQPQVENLSSKWFEKEYPMLLKLTHLLKDLDLVDGKLVNISDNASVFDENLLSRMHDFKSLVRTYIGYSATQLSLKKDLMSAESESEPRLLFSRASERQPMIVNSLTKVCNFLDISAQRRKQVRLSIIPQVTQHQIWAGAIEETLKALKSDMEVLNQRGFSKVDNIGQQIVVTCLKFLDDATSYDPESTSWMRPAPAKVISLPASQKWEDVLEMFNDLIICLRNEKELAFHLAKLEVMKEGLSQIKDVLIDKNIGYRETRYQESLVSKKLSKTLGHSSPCLFTLLLYYLYGSVKDIEVELCGGVNCNEGGNKFCLYMGKILILDEERMVWSGVKQLDRALGLFKLVWETSGMKDAIEVQGHLWCVGAETRSLTYKDADREQLCRLMDCQKLSLEACTHAAQNERLPLRIIVQVLFFEQLQLRTSISSCYHVSDNIDGSRQLRSGLVASSDGGWNTAVRENQVLKVGMDSLGRRVSELEKECSNMKQEIQKLGRAGTSTWGNMSKKLGFNLKSQMCSAQEGSVSNHNLETRKGEKTKEKHGKHKNKQLLLK